MAGSLPPSGVQLVAQDVAQFLSDIGKADRALTSFGDTPGRVGGAFSALGEVATGALRRIGELAVDALGQAAQAAGKFITDSVGVAGDFEQTLNVLGATSGASAAELEAVGKKAKELGADLTLPATSANEAATVMLELSKAGFSVQEAMDAAKGSLQLAAAAQVDGATAANIMSGALHSFELPASDAVRVADLLAAGANASSASMADLSQGVNQAGFAFHAAGLPIEDLVTGVAQLTNVGLTGSDAGTALKNAMMRLMDPTEKASKLMASLGINVYDANGKMKPFPQILDTINAATKGMTDEQRNAALGTIFLSDGMKAMIPLLAMGSEGFNKLKSDISQQGAAAEVANAQMQGWNGAVAGLRSQLETLQLTIGQQLLPLLTPLAQQAAVIVGQIGAMAEKFFILVPSIAASEDPLRTFFLVMGQVIPGSMAFMVQLIGVAQQIGPVVQAMAAFAVAAFQGLLAAAQSVFQTVVSIVQTILPAVLAYVQAWGGVLLGFWQQNGASIMAFWQQAWTQVQAILQVAAQIIAQVFTVVAGFINAHGAEIVSYLTTAWQTIQSVIQTALDLIQGILTVVLAAINGDWAGAWAALQQTSATFVTNIVRVVENGATLLGKAVDLGITLIKDAWAALVQSAPGIGSSFIGGIASGIGSAIGGLVDAARRAAQKAIDAVKATLKISSPSKIGIELGEFFGKGMALGMDRMAPLVTSAGAGMVSPLAQPPAYAAASANVTTYGPTYQMPIYTNQSPAVLQQSLAVVEALSL